MVANQQTNEPELNIVQPTLALKMVRIMGAVGNVAKGGTNSQQNYKFIQSDDVVDAIRIEMVKNNVAVFAKAVSYELSEGTTKSGNPNYHAVVQFEFMLVDADSGETMSCTWFGESIDTSDKSFNKAATAALKYWLMKTFMISAGEPDADSETPERTPRQALRGNGQQDRRIPPKSNQDAPNSSAASKTPPTTNGDPDVNAWDENAVRAFIQFYDGKMAMPDLLTTLKVKRFGDWKQGAVLAYKTIEQELKLRAEAF